MSHFSAQQRQQHFVHLGRIFSSLGAKTGWSGYNCGINESEFMAAEVAVMRAPMLNPWFTEKHVRMQLTALGEMLNESALSEFSARYCQRELPQKRVAVITAGNLPLVGFHDIFCVIMSGHHAVIKISSDDAGLTPMVLQLLDAVSGGAWKPWEVISGKLTQYDAVIATGSNNTKRYFEQYFGHVPHIFRGNRTSVAVLTGNEAPETLQLLAKDIFSYFGMGCRNVGKVFIPDSFDIQWIFQNILSESDVIQHHKYANNYDYFRALYMLNNEPFLENGFLIVKEDAKLHSPIGVLFTERYTDLNTVYKKLADDAASLQCVVGEVAAMVPFGQTQFPQINSFADGVDTMAFLRAL
jgi:hypothetical protein